MSTRTVPIDESLSPEQALLADRIGNEVYASHYAERKAYRLILACGTVLLCGSMWLNFSLARHPVVNRYVRIDEMGRAQAIQYSDLNYTPREGEVRTYLTDWANYRYTKRDTIASKYPLNYYFLSQSLASQLMGEDNRSHLVSQVMAGQIEQSDVEVRDVTITVHVRAKNSGSEYRSRHGAGCYRQTLFAGPLPPAAHRALDVERDLLPEPGTGERPGQNLPAVRDHQSAWIDDHGIPRKSRLR